MLNTLKNKWYSYIFYFLIDICTEMVDHGNFTNAVTHVNGRKSYLQNSEECWIGRCSSNLSVRSFFNKC